VAAGAERGEGVGDLLERIAGGDRRFQASCVDECREIARSVASSSGAA